jgi:hypothetical protein
MNGHEHAYNQKQVISHNALSDGQSRAFEIICKLCILFNTLCKKCAAFVHAIDLIAFKIMRDATSEVLKVGNE